MNHASNISVGGLGRFLFVAGKGFYRIMVESHKVMTPKEGEGYKITDLS